MTMEVRWTIPAQEDLDAVFYHIADDDPDAAQAVVRGIRKTADSLAGFPSLGGIGRIAGTRELLAEHRYYIVYRVMDDEVQILNIIHTSRQYPPE